MLTKKILIGLLTSFFCLGLAGVVIAGDYEKPYVSLSNQFTSMNMNNEDIDFDYSPRMDSSGLETVSSMNADSDVIEFDYSPREDSKIIATLPSMNTDSEDIQFDYSPRPMNCGTPYC